VIQLDEEVPMYEVVTREMQPRQGHGARQRSKNILESNFPNALIIRCWHRAFRAFQKDLFLVSRTWQVPGGIWGACLDKRSAHREQI
jgi:hypothetical protein